LEFASDTHGLGFHFHASDKKINPPVVGVHSSAEPAARRPRAPARAQAGASERVLRAESPVSTKRQENILREYQSLSYTRWDRKFHLVFIPKRRKKAVLGVLPKDLVRIFRELAEHKESEVVEGRLMSDQVHRCLTIPPKYAVSNVVGYIKGKSAIAIGRNFGGRMKKFTREVFWARVYFVSTVGLDEEIVRACIREQEREDERIEKMKLNV
jgi:putative transposase